jgi:AcrR family transcriptional regulator
VEAIAARAEVNRERIYAYFGSKKGLFAAVLRDAFDGLSRQEAGLLALGDDAAPQLAHRLMDHYVRFHADHPDFWRLLSWENLEGGEHVAGLRGVRDEALAHLRRLYALGQKRGAYAPDLSFEAFMFLVSAVSFFAFANRRTMRQTLQVDLGRAEVRDRLLGDVLRLVATSGRAGAGTAGGSRAVGSRQKGVA